MLLTDELIDKLHIFRVGRMRLWTKALQSICAATGTECGGGYVSFAGNGSPRSHAYGIGHRGTEFDLNEIDEFFKGRASNWELIVTPFSSSDVLKEAFKLGYVPGHFRSVMAMTAPDSEPTLPPGIQIEEIIGDDLDLWIRTSDAGWNNASHLADTASELRKLMSSSSARRYIAWFHGEPAAAASAVSYGGITSFGGACTRIQFRNKGLQTALTHRRLADAVPGSIVQVIATPGKQSHRNLQRAGFQPLYSKLVLSRLPAVDQEP